MSFDRLAPHYRWMEWLLAGSKLQRCRTAFIGNIFDARRALLLGEGNGRFLVELLRAHPDIEVTCLDASAAMLSRARARLRALGLDKNSVEFVHADILNWSPRKGFDLIASHFFLDCFRPDQLTDIVSKLASTATPEAYWLLADFREPPSGWAQKRARIILKAMYLFFRCVTRLPAQELTSPDRLLQEHGFGLSDRRVFEWGLLHSDLWTRAMQTKTGRNPTSQTIDNANVNRNLHAHHRRGQQAQNHRGVRRPSEHE